MSAWSLTITPLPMPRPSAPSSATARSLSISTSDGRIVRYTSAEYGGGGVAEAITSAICALISLGSGGVGGGKRRLYRKTPVKAETATRANGSARFKPRHNRWPPWVHRLGRGLKRASQFVPT